MASSNDRSVTQLLTCKGGVLCLPPFSMIDREDGGNLWVMPPRSVWDRSELNRDELVQWSFLIAASGRAMLDVLPQLACGVINYWEAGNWALNEDAEPKGPKVGNIHKKVHMHLIGRSPNAKDPDWKWGEAPMYSYYKEVDAWLANKDNLMLEECRAVVDRTVELLVDKYAVDINSICVVDQVLEAQAC